MKVTPNFDIKFFSSYYISVLIGYFLLRLDFFNSLLRKLSSWLLSILLSSNINVTTNGPVWLVFFFSTFIITWIIQAFIVIPLGFYIDKNIGFNSNWEKIILFIFIFGAQVYLLNENFSQPMPSEWLHPWIIKALGGEANTFIIANRTALVGDNAWAVFQYIWYLGPICYLYFFAQYRTKSV